MSRRRRLLAALVLLGPPLLLLGLFVLNGTVLAAGETPVTGHLADVPAAPSASGPGEVTVLAYNVAKGWAPRGGLSFHDRARVERRLAPMAALIRAERPDVVVLSEVMTEAGPCRLDQVEYLARACGLPYTVFGENYNFGLPGYRVVGGNAVLSRTPLEAVANIPLSGRKPFYATSNSRRALFGAADIGGRRVLIGALHNDSYDPKNNEVQVGQLLGFVGDRPCVLAGDFNAPPDRGSIRRVRESGQFGGAFDGPPTFPDPDEARPRRIDYVFAPAGWDHLATKVIAADPSDHRPVVARFRVR